MSDPSPADVVLSELFVRRGEFCRYLIDSLDDETRTLELLRLVLPEDGVQLVNECIARKEQRYREYLQGAVNGQ